MQIVVLVELFRKIDTGIKSRLMITEAAVLIQQVAGVGIAFEAKSCLVAELAELLVEAGIGCIRIIVVAVIVAGARILYISLCEVVPEILIAAAPVPDRFETGFELGLAVQQRIAIVRLQGQVMCVAEPPVALQWRLPVG